MTSLISVAQIPNLVINLISLFLRLQHVSHRIAQEPACMHSLFSQSLHVQCMTYVIIIITMNENKTLITGILTGSSVQEQYDQVIKD
jgi:hypothetical protein